MRVRVELAAGTHTLPLPTPGSAAVDVGVPCPHCAKPLRATGRNRRREHDRYTADAACVECNALVGRLVVKVPTLFGLDEDDAVLNGRPRVYDNAPTTAQTIARSP